MKRRLLLGVSLAFAAILMFSCNKNRFDFSELETVEGSGEWNLPIGSARASLKQVLTQLNYNGMIRYDADSNLYIAYDYTLDNILSGKNFMTIAAFGLDFDFELPNEFYGSGVPLPVAMKDTLYCQQRIELSSDSVSSIDYVKIESGMIGMVPTSNMFTVKSWTISSPDITNPEWPGDTLCGDAAHLDLSGATFHLNEEAIVLNYVIVSELDSTILEQPQLHMHASVELKDLVLEELKGHLASQSQRIAPVDTTFFLPVNVSGDIALKNAKLVLKHKNTFGGLNAMVSMDTLEFYGADGVTSPIFPEGFAPNLAPTGDEMVEQVFYPNFDLNTQHNSFRLGGEAVFNPGGVSNDIVIRRTSVLGLGVGVEIPFSFESDEGVFYLDTFDIDISKVEVPDLVNKVVLHITFDSKFPFNLDAQLYTLDDNDQITGQILDNGLDIDAWVSGAPVVTNTNVSVTHESLNRLFESKKLLLKAGLNTGGTTASINVNNSLGLTLKADVIYGGELDIHNN